MSLFDVIFRNIIGFDGIVTPEGKISIIECNTFLRNHDAQCILSLLNQDIYKIMEACVIGVFADDYNYIDLKDEFAVAGVLSSGKYIFIFPPAHIAPSVLT